MVPPKEAWSALVASQALRAKSSTSSGGHEIVRNPSFSYIRTEKKKHKHSKSSVPKLTLKRVKDYIPHFGKKKKKKLGIFRVDVIFSVMGKKRNQELTGTVHSIHGKPVAEVDHLASHCVVARPTEFPHTLMVVLGHAPCQSHPRYRELHRPRLSGKNKNSLAPIRDVRSRFWRRSENTT